MKAVAVALVLIAGAAVVLWFGNTLTSPVLDGLIGGLAALLLSIPIALTLFAYLSRRHDERLRVEAEAEEQEAMAYGYYSEDAPQTRLTRRVYIERSVVDSQPPSVQEEEYHWLDERQGYNTTRQLPTPTSQRLPAARQLPAPASQRLPAARQGQLSQKTSTSLRAGEAAAPKQQQARNAPAARTKDLTSRRTTRRIATTGLAANDPDAFQSRHRLAALRAARQEAVEQYDDVDVEMFPPHDSQQLPASKKVSRSLREPQDKVERHPRTTRQLRRVADTTTSEGQVYPADPETAAGNLNRPMVRRAPYSYQDDDFPGMPPQTNSPITRRSSLFETTQPRKEE